MFSCPGTLSFSQCFWVLQGRLTGSVQLQEVSPTQALKEEKNSTRRIAAFPKTNVPLSSLSLKVVNMVENVVHPLALQKIPQPLSTSAVIFCH